MRQAPRWVAERWGQIRLHAQREQSMQCLHGGTHPALLRRASSSPSVTWCTPPTSELISGFFSRVSRLVPCAVPTCHQGQHQSIGLKLGYNGGSCQHIRAGAVGSAHLHAPRACTTSVRPAHLVQALLLNVLHSSSGPHAALSKLVRWPQSSADCTALHCIA